MKKSSVVSLALCASLAMFGGCEKKKDQKQDNDWSVETDTQNPDEVHAYNNGGMNPFLMYWLISNTGQRSYYYGGYNSQGRYFTRSSGDFASGRGFTGGRVFSSHSIGRGGFGAHGLGAGS
jgi:hypothetical protein